MRTKELEMRIKKLEGEMEELAWMASSLRMHVEGKIEDMQEEIEDNAKKLEQELFDKYDDDELNQDVSLFVEAEVHNYKYEKTEEMYNTHKELFENDVKYTELEFEVNHQISNDFDEIKDGYYENTEEKLDEIEKVMKQMNKKLEKIIDYEYSKE